MPRSRFALDSKLGAKATQSHPSVRPERRRTADANAAETPGPTHRALGSLIGRLGRSSAQNGSAFCVHDRQTGWATPVTCDAELRRTLTGALGETVIASGELWRDAQGKPQRLKLAKLVVIDRDGLPSVADVSGIAPDFTGGLSSEDYVRQIRDGDCPQRCL